MTHTPRLTALALVATLPFAPLHGQVQTSAPPPASSSQAAQPTSVVAPGITPTTPSRHMAMSGYLPQAALPDSATILPPPPATASLAQARDDEAAAAAVAQQGSARWKLAVADAELMAPDAIGAFSCAAGFDLGAQATPAISALLRRAAADIAISTFAAKRKYQRPRPFMVNGKPSCTPDMEPLLRRDGSYPSGHSALGYGEGLILAEVVPSRATALVARGKAFGDSRRLCNVHWLSDIEEGRIMASATLARLHAEPAFQKDVAAARAEADRILASGAKPGRDCAAETATLATTR
ncbi:phosphatase PAP2 family protein [Sphingobium sufflavum]|uniref:acid phosphatase n=1 Tax=Sphingobium sufflavum TaxID=1129547 RepID=UPI001F28DF2A|nr:phosphatase PAP2 family protein [Sphingobium sufflavum]MCE7797212.1 phosphatase PAP2 family protein [Sphingobium sufflavum]